MKSLKMVAVILTTLSSQAFALQFNGKFITSDVVSDRPGNFPACYNDGLWGSPGYWKPAGNLELNKLSNYGHAVELVLTERTKKCEILLTSSEVTLINSETKFRLALKGVQWEVVNDRQCLANASRSEFSEYLKMLEKTLGPTYHPKNSFSISGEISTENILRIQKLTINKFDSNAYCRGLGVGYEYTGLFEKIL